jgi:DNA repair exonuclease SbcCD nuclease subunit
MLIAHISDLHLGRKSPGDANGAERLNAFRKALATLAGFGPDALVIAGDTFDGPNVDAAIVEEAARSLARLGQDGADIPVVLISGNHDPAEAHKLWALFQKALGSSACVHLVLTPRLIELAEGKLLVEAYPCLTRFSAQAPWDSRPAVVARSDAVRVVVAHGTLQGGPVPEGETDAYPFSQPELEALGADYVALGHFHGVYPPWGEAEHCQRSFCYSGTHEPDQFGGDAGYALLATVVAGQATRLERIKVGRRQWQLLQLAGPADLARVEKLHADISAGNDPSRYVIRLRVGNGASWTAEDIARLEHLEAALRALGSHIERRGTLQARVDSQALDLNGLPSGAVKEALLSLRSDLQQTVDENRREVLNAALQVGWEKIQEFMPS